MKLLLASSVAILAFVSAVATNGGGRCNGGGNNRVCNTGGYKCPENSQKKPDRKCYDNFHDCKCDDGFEKEFKGNDLGVCKPKKELNCTFECPPLSTKIPDRKCYNNFHDCKCDSGYEKDKTSKTGGSCKKVEDLCTYKCPEFSSPIPGRKCYDTFADCKCQSGYKGVLSENRVDGVCKKMVCDFKCPANSYRKPNRNCYDNFDDCKCEFDHMKSGQECVPKKAMQAEFQMPNQAAAVEFQQSLDDEVQAFDSEIEFTGDDEFQEDDEEFQEVQVELDTPTESTESGFSAVMLGGSAAGALIVGAIVGAAAATKKLPFTKTMRAGHVEKTKDSVVGIPSPAEIINPAEDL